MSEPLDRRIVASVALIAAGAADSDCFCGAVVNEENQEEIEEAAKDVDCEGRLVRCAILSNPRCENGTCVADVN